MNEELLENIKKEFENWDKKYKNLIKQLLDAETERDKLKKEVQDLNREITLLNSGFKRGTDVS